MAHILLSSGFYFVLLLLPITALELTTSVATCVKRSMLYTSGSATFVVSEFSYSSMPLIETGCSITVTLPQATTTVYASSPTATDQSMIADGGFEDGNSVPFETAASSSDVSAKIMNGGPIGPASGSQYLLITYTTPTSGSKHRRQAANANTYNLTQSFSATAGTQYTVSARAEAASNGGSDPSCTLQLCSADACGPANTVTTSYQPYSYTFVASSSGSALATLSFACIGPAYVGVDNVAARANVGSNDTPQAAETVTVTTSIYQGNVSLSQPARTVTITTSAVEEIQTVTETLFRPSSYAIYQNITNDHSVTTTEFSTALETTSVQGSNNTLTTTVVTTAVSTATLDFTATQTSTVYSTAYSTAIEYSTTTQVVSTVIISSRPDGTVTYTTSAPVVTYTLPAQTMTATATEIDYSSITTTLPAGTETATQSETTSIFVTNTATRTNNFTMTTTLPAQTLTETGTTVSIITDTETTTNTETPTAATSTTTAATCDPSPLKGGDFADLSQWAVDPPTPGYLDSTPCCADTAPYGRAVFEGGHVGKLSQSIVVCPGLTYSFSFIYEFDLGPPDPPGYFIHSATASYEIYANGVSIGAVFIDNGVDQFGNSQFGGWYTFEGSYLASSSEVLVETFLTASSAPAPASLYIDSFVWIMNSAASTTSSMPDTTTTTSTTSTTSTSSTSTTATCDPSPLKGGDFDDLSQWTVVLPPYGYSDTICCGPGNTFARVILEETGPPAQLSQTISTCAGTTYDFSFLYSFISFLPAPSTAASLAIYAGGTQIAAISDDGREDQFGNENTDWYSFSGSYTAVSTTTLVEVVVSFSSGFDEFITNIDNFFWTIDSALSSTTTTSSTSTTSSSPSCTSDPSPLKGGDFDDYASWVVGQPSTGSFQITSGGPDSTYSRVGVLTRGVVGELNQTIQTCPGVYYAYTFVYNFFNINALHDDIAVISLYADDDHIGNIIAYTSGDTNGYYNGNWHSYQGLFMASSSSTLIGVLFGGENFAIGIDTFTMAVSP